MRILYLAQIFLKVESAQHPKDFALIQHAMIEDELFAEASSTLQCLKKGVTDAINIRIVKNLNIIWHHILLCG
jgi:hypothetical protein